MSSPPRRDTARDSRRESSGDESETDRMLEEARRIALEAQQRFLDLQRRSHEKATPPAPAPTPATAELHPQEDPHLEHPAPPLPADPRGPAPPPPAPAPAAPAPQPARTPDVAPPRGPPQEQPSPTPSPPKKRIPAKQVAQDLARDEEPLESYHNLREQDEDGNFIHSSDEDEDQDAQVEEDPQPNPQQQQGHRRRKEGRRSEARSPQQERVQPSPAPPTFLTKDQRESIERARQRKMSKMAADIQKVLRRDLRHLAGSDQDERVDDHLEKAMENYEELRQVEKDHREMMDQFLSSAKEARTLLELGADGSPSTEATAISKVKGKITSFQRYRAVLQTKAALIKKLWWRAATCKAERDVVRLIQDFDLLGADCERLEMEESRKRKGSSASGPSSAKKSKPAPKEDAKDLENQLEKARLEGVREGLEKREASLSSAQTPSKRGGGRGRGRGRGKGGNQRGKGQAATDSTPKKEKD